MSLQYNHIVDALPGLCYWKDTKSQYLGCNQAVAKSLGMLSAKAIVGCQDTDLPWAQEAENYLKFDADVLQGKHVSMVEKIYLKHSGCCYAITRKSPIYNDLNKIEGIFGQAFLLSSAEVVNSIQDIYQQDRHLFDEVELSNYQVLDNFPSLTQRETECLFYFLRKYSAKNIAVHLGISARTVEQHIVSIKRKYHCATRAALLEFCFNKGLHRIILSSIIK